MKKMVPVLAVFFMFTLTVYAQPATHLAAFETAYQLFETNLAGDKDSNPSVIKQFTTLVQNHPEQPLFLAYLGSAYTLKARDAFAPWTRLSNVDRGLDMVDKALIMLEPEHDEMKLRGSVVSMETRLVAISTFLKVPGFLNRLQPAKDLLTETLADPVFNQAPAIVRGRIYLNAADAAKRDKDVDKERHLLTKAAEILPDSRFKTEAQSRLQALQN